MCSGSGSNRNEEVTRLLVQWGDGNEAALNLLLPILYDELHRLAESYLRKERDARTLQPTALINEAYIRLIGQDLPDWQNRAHFFGVAAQIMRQILVEHARKHHAQKRGSGASNLSLEEALHGGPEASAALIELEDALKELERKDARKAKVVELRFFGGLSIEETAQVLGISVATVGREQRFAEAWLSSQMKGTSP